MNPITELIDRLEARFNSILDQLEGPEGAIDRVLERQAAALTDARRQLADLQSGERALVDQITAEREQEAHWRERAEQAVTRGRDDLAREALIRARIRVTTIEDLEKSRASRASDIATLEAMLAHLEQEHRNLERDREILIARASLNRIGAELGQTREALGMAPSRTVSPEREREDEQLEREFAAMESDAAQRRATDKLRAMKEKGET